MRWNANWIRRQWRNRIRFVFANIASERHFHFPTRKLFPHESKILCLADCLRSAHDHFGWCQIASVVKIYFRLIYLTRKTASTEWFSHAFKVHSFHSIRSVCDSRFIHIKTGWWWQREGCKLNAERRRAKWRGQTEKISHFIRTEKKNMYFIPFYSFLTQYLHFFFFFSFFSFFVLSA